MSKRELADPTRKAKTQVGKDKGSISQGQRRPQENGATSLSSDSTVPMLKCGPSNNYGIFKKKIAIACMEKYKNLGRLINDKSHGL
jgi:hypothetical protein